MRRALGVTYCILAALPILGTLVYAATQDEILSVIIGTAIGLACFTWLRAAGFRGLFRMGSIINMLSGKEEASGASSRGSFAASVALTLWPWIAYWIAALKGWGILELAFAVIWLVEIMLLRLAALRRSRDYILEPRMEDWIAITAFPVAALLSTLPGLPLDVSQNAFLILSPFILFSGVKSLYEAPKEFVLEIGADTRR